MDRLPMPRALFICLLLLIAARVAAADASPEPADDDISPVALPDVTVTDRARPDQDATADKTKISGQTIRESARESTFDAIAQRAADVYVTSSGVFHGVSNGASGGVAIRGLGGSPNTQILLVEDGVPDKQGIFGHPIPDAYPPFLIDDVQVIKGGDSVLYGSNALGGVILIADRWRKPEGYEMDADTSYGSYETLRDTVGFLGHWGGWDAAGAFTYVSSNGHRPGAGGTDAIGQAAGRWTSPSGLSVTFRDKTIRLQGADPGPVQHPTPNNWYEVFRDDISAAVNYATPRVAFRAIPYANFGVTTLYNGFYAHDLTTGGLAECEIQPVDPLVVLVGVAGDDVSGAGTDLTTFDKILMRDVQTYSFYNQVSVMPVPSLLLLAGTRELYSPRYGFVFLYKGGARWTIIPGLDVRARVAKNFREPTIRELYVPFPTANPGLKPEQALNADAGFDLNFPHVEASVSAYRTDARNLIKYFGQWPAAEVINIDQLTIYGIEAHLGLTKLGPMSLFLDGDYQDVGTEYTAQNPREKYDFTIEGSHGWGPHQIVVDLSGERVRGLYQQNFERGAMPDVFFMDLSFRYRASLPRGITLSPYLIVRNLLNARYEFIEDYPMPGLNATVGLELGI